MSNDPILSIGTSEMIMSIVSILGVALSYFAIRYGIRKDNEKKLASKADVIEVKEMEKRIQDRITRSELENLEARKELMQELNVKLAATEKGIGNRITDMRENMNDRFKDLSDLIGRHLTNGK